MRAFAIVALLLAACCVCVAVAAAPGGGKRTVVIVDDHTIKKTHSKFFAALQARGHELTYVRGSDKDAAIDKYGDYIYDNIILFAPNTDAFGGSLSVQSIVQFIDAGGNVFLAGAPELSDPTREIAAECGLEFDEDKAMVLDHASFDDKDDGDHTLIHASDLINSQVILGSAKITAPVVFRGVGVAVIDRNPLVTKVLSGSSSSYTYNPDVAVKDNPVAMGRNTVLVAALQARNNARVVVAGSLEMFSDEFFAFEAKRKGKVIAAKAGNEAFAIELAKWAFQERGVLRASNVHYKAADNALDKPPSVRVKDQLEYSVEILEWDGSKWGPFAADDVQVEFVMLDPYERVTLKHNNKGIFSTSFQAPDVYGVFQFVLTYDKTGYSFLDARNQVSVLPVKHNEFERFIVTAYPYYASAISMLVAFFLFGVLFLRHDAPKSKIQ